MGKYINKAEGQTSPNEEVASLLNYVATAAGNTYTFGKLTPQIYDTAWVSLLRNPKNKNELLFTECHQYVMQHQIPGSGWESYDSEVDGVLNNLAGLLALKRNASATNSDLLPSDLERRVENASKCLQAKLDGWNVATCDYVGFEIIVPSMLEALEQEGVSFQFASKKLLMQLNCEKMSKIHPSIWSGKIQTTITHSLEAFVGKADFSGLKDQLLFGGMGSSPSSTAAYLMSLPEWNCEVENYLRTVINSKPLGSKNRGGVPGMFPTTGFETFWIVATLIEGGFDVKEPKIYDSIISTIDEFYDSLNGLASGFSRSSVADADDTAKSIMIRNLLGLPTNADRLVATFEGGTHFLTYPMERHPSVTTNCNVLSAMLLAPDREKYTSQIEKCAHFLCESWLRSDMVFMDKWNISELYPIMLMSESLMRLLEVWDKGAIEGISPALVGQQIPLALFQLLLQTLQKQNANGSWGHKPSREMTAYSIMSLANLASLPFASTLYPQIKNAIENGRKYITNQDNMLDNEYIWIAKVSYSPINISRAYIASAQNVTYPKASLSDKLIKLANIPQKGVQKYSKIFSHLATTSSFPLWKIQGSIMEGYLFLKKLKQVKLDLFDRTGMKRDDYFDFIAMTFCCANNLNGTFLEADVLFEMMVMVLRVYQVDEFVEHIIGKQYSGAIQNVKDAIKKLSILNGKGPAILSQDNISTPEIASVRAKLETFAGSVLNNHLIQNATDYDCAVLTHELRTCLLSHLEQLEDSGRVCNNPTTEFTSTNLLISSGSYHSWVLSTGASHSCAPLSLAFLRCLLSSPNDEIHNSSEVRYLIQDIWMHLSAKCRMENDRASLARDRKEGNLNSMDFPEFTADERRENGSREKVGQKSKKQLTRIIDYEKACIKMAMRQLEEVVGAKDKTLKSLQFYYFLSDVYNDVYAMRDISCQR